VIPALVTAIVFLGFNLVAAVVSVRIDAHGLPPEVSAQTVRRKPGDLRRRAPLILLNLVAVSGGTVFGVWLLQDAFAFGWPGLLPILAQLVILLVVDDAVFYAIHRAMHEVPWLYRTFHAKHHEAYAPVPIEILYTNPLETSLVTFGMVGGMALVYGIWGWISFAAFLSYVVFRHLHELDVHSGTRSVLAHRIPLLAPNEHHDLHHHKPNCGNYASMLTLWDDLLGTRVVREAVEEGERTRRRAA
jgi:sterol desaturase/sphingolipid hydroxylase (fatty acid hydroxylase superfamily)